MHDDNESMISCLMMAQLIRSRLVRMALFILGYPLPIILEQNLIMTFENIPESFVPLGSQIQRPSVQSFLLA